MSFKKNRFLFLSFIICANTILPSIISGTLIKTPHGFIKAENIAIRDTLTGYDQNSLSAATIAHIATSATDTVIVITTQKGSFYASPDQQFFDPILQQWIAAKDITTQTTFLDAQLNHCACSGIETIHVPATKIYCISTTAPHNFFITEQELLTHNAFPVVIGLAWLFGEGLKFAGLTIGTTLLGSYIGVQLYNAQKQKDKNFALSLEVQPRGCNPDPDDDDKNFFESIKLKSDKKMRHRRFGNFYRDSNTKLWWSRDNANHGGSTFKVFKETAKGLEWIFDADHLGNQIIAKHKGPVGSFITYKELIACP